MQGHCGREESLRPTQTEVVSKFSNLLGLRPAGLKKVFPKIVMEIFLWLSRLESIPKSISNKSDEQNIKYFYLSQLRIFLHDSLQPLITSNI